MWTHPANSSSRLRSTGRALRYQIVGRIAGKSTVVPLGDRSKIVAYYDDIGSRRAAYSRVPDHREMRVWMATLGPGDLFVDVGANVGLYSLLAAERGATVVAIEPLAEASDQLETNLAINGYHAEIHHVALGPHRGSMALDGADGQRMHLQTRVNGGQRSVQVLTLDEVLGDRIATGVKIDVEGAERLVLEGAHQALAERRLRLIQLEWNDLSLRNFGETRERLASLLDHYGYELLRPTSDRGLAPVDDLEPGDDLFARPAD